MGVSWEPFEHTKFPLAQYAADHYGEHVRLAGGDRREPLQSLLKAFFAFNSRGFRNLLSIQHYKWNPIFAVVDDYPKYPLYHMCKHGFYQTIKPLLEEPTKSWLETTFPWSLSSTKGSDCVAAAASHGHLEVVKLLLENGAAGESALQEAARRCDLEVTKFLVENGVNVNSKGDFRTTLECAVDGGDVEVVRLLLDHGADVKAQSGATLSMAASYNRLDVVKLLLDHGADVNAREVYIRSPLQEAASCGGLEVVRLLLDHGADVNANKINDGSALHKAASGGHLEVVKLLLDLGANVNAEGGNVRSALQQAALRGDLEIVKLLLENGSNGGTKEAPLFNKQHPAAIWRWSSRC